MWRVPGLPLRIEAWGAELWYLPSYWPDLTPIEEAPATKIKSFLRRAEARVFETLSAAIWTGL